jgi:hypothetical protein
MTAFAPPVLPSLFSPEADIRAFDRDLITGLQAWAINQKGLLDKGLSFSDNIDCDIVEFTSHATPDTEVAVAHGLGKIPACFLVASLDKGGVVYKGSSAFTSTAVYIKCTVASTAVKLILL